MQIRNFSAKPLRAPVGKLSVEFVTALARRERRIGAKIIFQKSIDERRQVVRGLRRSSRGWHRWWCFLLTTRQASDANQQTGDESRSIIRIHAKTPDGARNTACGTRRNDCIR